MPKLVYYPYESMSPDPYISVILPFYNAESTLHRAIESILNQAEEDFELILVDNNSNDGSRLIAEKFSKTDSRIILLNETGKGVVYASNSGAAIARGKYVSRMDADDEALPNKLFVQKTYLDANPHCAAVAGLAEHIPFSKHSLGFSRFVEWSNSILTYEQILNNRFIEMPVINPTLVWRRDAAKQYGLYRNGNFPEDYEMILRWLDAGARIEKVPEIVLKWYDSETRLTRTDEHYSEKFFYGIKSQYLAAWLSRNNPYHPYVSVWGASRISRRRASMLESFGIHFRNYIDTKKSRQIDKEIIYYKDLPSAGELFILSYIKQMDNREKIREFLNKSGYKEGKNYLMVS